MANKGQIDHIKEAAKQVEADTADDAPDKVMEKLDLTKKPDSESIGDVEKPKK